MRTSYPSSFTSLVSGKAVGGIVYDDFSPYRGPTVSQCKAENLSKEKEVFYGVKISKKY